MLAVYLAQRTAASQQAARLNERIDMYDDAQEWRPLENVPRQDNNARPWDGLMSSTILLPATPQASEKVHHDRLTEFQLLVRRYMIQYRYGCLEPQCITSTCFSCVRRSSEAPPRRPTVLTARAMAYHLAAQVDPHQGLCTNTPAVSPVTLKPTQALLEEIGSEEMKNGFLPLSAWWTQENNRRARFDNKSFTQNLFRTHAAKMFDSIDDSAMRRLLENSESRSRSTVEPASLRETPSRVAMPSTRPRNSEPRVSFQQNGSSGNADQRTTQGSAEDDTSPEIHPQSTPTRTFSAHANGSSTEEKNMHVKGRHGGYKITLTNDETRLPSAKEVSARPNHLGQTLSSMTKEKSHPSSSPSPRLMVSPLTFRHMIELRALLKAHTPPTSRIGSEETCIFTGKRSLNEVEAFVHRSLSQNLSRPELLAASFNGEISDGSTFRMIIDAFAACKWKPLVGSLIFDSLSHSLACLFVPPPGLKARRNTRGKCASINGFSGDQPGQKQGLEVYCPENIAHHIIGVCLYALLSSVSDDEASWSLASERNRGRLWTETAAPSLKEKRRAAIYTDILEYEPALRLADRLVRAIAARKCFAAVELANSGTVSDDGFDGPPTVMDSLIEHLINFHRLGHGINDHGNDLSLGTIPALMEILRTLVLKNWDGSHRVKRWGVVGAALEIMEDLFDEPEAITGVDKSRSFFLPHIAERVDTIEFIKSYSQEIGDPNTRHLLSFPFVFRDEHIVSFFRAMNFAAMSHSFSLAGNNYHLQVKFKSQFMLRRWAEYLDQHYSVASSRYLLLDIRRSHALEDTLDQLWGLEKRQLLRPLKIRMGAEEGERGVDQGGVTQEFFKVALAEAFNPDNGMFTLDPTTRMAWFQPLSLAPLSHFQLIGLLFSLALYNGVTLPATFPLALYAHLLSLPCTEISDGWPAIARSFDYILSSTDNIAETICCGYEFAFEARGQTFHINMQHDNPHLPSPQTLFDCNDEVWATGAPIIWPIPLREEDEAGLVTNENRHQYVKDYTHWLTYESVRPQLDAFAEGFQTCVPAPSLSILSPTLLRSIIEGATIIDTHALERVTRYEAGYDAKHPFIKMFWKIVHGYSNDEKRRLLEFVTASDRVPVQGIEKVAFWVQRNGPDVETLPTSSTCFGRLLLPEYQGEGKLKRKLAIALENSRGFGTA